MVQRIRSKLLVFFLLVSLAPLLLGWGGVRRDMTDMGEKSADRSGNLLVRKASQSLERVVAVGDVSGHRFQAALSPFPRTPSTFPS